MKKQLGLFTACLMASISSAQADILGFEVGAYQWKPDYSGIFASDEGNDTIDRIDLENDLGYSDESHNILWFSLEHPVPILPNIKVVSSDLEASANAELTRSIEFNGETFSASADVTSTFDLSNTEFTLYYEILDNWVNLDLGLTARMYDGEARIASTELSIDEVEAIDFTIPLLYAATQSLTQYLVLVMKVILV